MNEEIILQTIRLLLCNKPKKWLVGSSISILHAFFVFLTYKRVPSPYMDEIFHIDQTRRFCSADFSWNNKITTPPALYVFSIPFFCGQERYFNSFLVCFTFVGLYDYHRIFSSSTNVLTSVASLCLPVLFHSSILYYTDLLSLTCLLWALSSKSPTCAAVFSFFGILTRQTNIVWAAFYAFIYLVKHCSSKNIVSSLFKSLYEVWSFILLALAVLFFLILNDGRIVLGDHKAHKIVPHFMQLYYFSIFAVFHSAPTILCCGYVKEALKTILSAPVKALLLSLIIVSCIYCFTMDHPYLLADNRHYTFYIWRRFFLLHPFCKYMLVPIYLVALYAMKESVKNLSPVLIISFIVSCIAVLVPAHLLEPRYFIPPFILWRLSIRDCTNWMLAVEILYLISINVVTLFLFFERPFEWSHEPNVQQRFMW